MGKYDSQYIGIQDGSYNFVFRCEGCGVQGALSVKTTNHRFECPDECGAVYIMWNNDGTPELKCVVCPVFETEGDEEVDECAYCDEWERCTCFDD